MVNTSSTLKPLRALISMNFMPYSSANDCPLSLLMTRLCDRSHLLPHSIILKSLSVPCKQLTMTFHWLLHLRSYVLG